MARGQGFGRDRPARAMERDIDDGGDREKALRESSAMGDYRVQYDRSIGMILPHWGYYRSCQSPLAGGTKASRAACCFIETLQLRKAVRAKQAR